MRIHNLPLLALALLAPRALLGQPTNEILDRGRADKVVVGMRIETLFDLYGSANVRLVPGFGEGHFFPLAQVYLPSEPSAPAFVARIAPRCGRYFVDGITVHSTRFRTREGIGVGSTIGDIRRQFPRAGMNRENSPSVIVEALQMTFSLPARSAQFADSVRVESIWMWTPMPDSLAGPCR